MLLNPPLADWGEGVGSLDMAFQPFPDTNNRLRSDWSSSLPNEGDPGWKAGEQSVNTAR
jgi:hypothetical protein